MNIHSDYSKRVVINHNDLPWKSSPEAKVERRMLDRIGDEVARFADYELGFQMILLNGDTKPSMTLSKYDYKNNRFLEHYKCDVEMTNIE